MQINWIRTGYVDTEIARTEELKWNNSMINEHSLMTALDETMDFSLYRRGTITFKTPPSN